jgi:hypothetical protein
MQLPSREEMHMADLLPEKTAIALVEESLGVQVSLMRRRQEMIAQLESRMQAAEDQKAIAHSPGVAHHP